MLVVVDSNNSFIPLSDKIKLNFTSFNEIDDDINSFITNVDFSSELNVLLQSMMDTNTDTDTNTHTNTDTNTDIDTDTNESIHLKPFLKTTNNVSFKQKPGHSSRFTNKLRR